MRELLGSGSSPSVRRAQGSSSSTTPPGNTQTPGMKLASGLRRTEQDLEPTMAVLPTPAQEDDRGGATRGRGSHPRATLDDRFRAVRTGSWVSCPAMPTETQTAQLWICTSCGFIYDPDEGDPDGGIPPGTPFDADPRRLVLPGVRRPQGGLRALRGVGGTARRPAASARGRSGGRVQRSVALTPQPLAPAAGKERSEQREGQERRAGDQGRANRDREHAAGVVEGVADRPRSAGSRLARPR